jgi:hypothetical protein
MERALRIVSDHLWFADRHPEVIEEAARRAHISNVGALALGIVTDLFDADAQHGASQSDNTTQSAAPGAAYDDGSTGKR